MSESSTAVPPRRATTSADAATAGRQAGQTFAWSLDNHHPAQPATSAGPQIR